MMEVLLSVVLFLCVAMGLGLGLLVGRAPPRTSCGAAACLPERRCDDCPLRHSAEKDQA